jgi:hypothetical protein
MLRIRKTRWKLAYCAAALFAIVVLNRVFDRLGLPEIVHEAASSALFLAVFLIGARSFRGEGEPVLQPRRWWRTTARPRAGLTLSVLFLAGVLIAVVSALTRPAAQSITNAGSAITYAVLAGAYVNSSIRLIRGRSRK